MATDDGSLVERLFAPKRVAIVGASDKAGTIRGRVLANALRHGFDESTAFPVNPSRETVLGLTCYPTVSAIPGGVESAVIAVPAANVADVVADCGRSGVRVAIVLSSGFADADEVGRGLQEQLVKVARSHGVRLLGPNCMGAIDLGRDVFLSQSSAATLSKSTGAGRGIAFVSQSGGFGSLVMTAASDRGVRLSKVATTGNEADLTWADVVTGLAEDPEVSVIMGYLENVRDGHAFSRALMRARQTDTPVVLLKAGRQSAGLRAAQAHTGMMVGDRDVFDAVLRRYSVVQVADIRELLDASSALSVARSAGRRIAVVSGSGGLCAALADRATDLGLEVPPLGESTERQLREVLPAFASAINPVDLTGQATDVPDLRETVLKILCASGDVDMVGMFMGRAGDADAARSEFARVSEQSPVPLVCCMLGAGELTGDLIADGIPASDDFTSALAGMRALGTYGNPEPAGAVARPVDTRCPEPTSAGPFDVWAAMASAGLPTVARDVIARAGVEQHVAQLDHPVFIKAAVEGVAHKTEMGGVVGPVRPGDLAPLKDMLIRLPDVGAFEVQRAVTAQWELIVSVKWDDTFGWVGVVGVGGILAEVQNQTVVFPEPYSLTEFTDVVSSSPLAFVFSGTRGIPGVDPVGVFQVMKGLAAIARTHVLSVIECNPVVIDTALQPVIVDCVAEGFAAVNDGGVTSVTKR